MNEVTLKIVWWPQPGESPSDPNYGTQLSVYIENFDLFLAAALALAIVPGPGMLYVMARTVGGGKSEGMASAFGTALGGLVHVALAVAGLSALTAASAEALSVLKYFGAAYLVYLGVRSILKGAGPSGTGAQRSMGVIPAFREGVVTEVLNVKTALFFLAFIPQFAGIDPSPSAFLLLGSICVVLNAAADFVCVHSVDWVRTRLRGRRSLARHMTWASGGLIAALGLYLAFARGDKGAR